MACWMKGKASNAPLVAPSSIGVWPGLSTWAPPLADLKSFSRTGTAFSRSGFWLLFIGASFEDPTDSTPRRQGRNHDRARRLGTLGRLTAFRDGLQIFLARLGIVESAMGAASGSPNLRVRFSMRERLSASCLASKKIEPASRRFRRLPEARGLSQKIPARDRTVEHLSEFYAAPWNLWAAPGILDRAPEDSRGSQSSGTRSRFLERGAEDSRAPPYLPPRARIFQGLPNSSGARFKIRSAFRIFWVALEPSGNGRNPPGRARRFSRPLESSPSRP